MFVPCVVLPFTHGPHLHDRHEKGIPTSEEYLSHQRGLLCTERSVKSLLLAITLSGTWGTIGDAGNQSQVAVYKASIVPIVLSIHPL